MGRANPIWGAPRIHGELLKLGIKFSQASVAKYMLRQNIPQQSRATTRFGRLLHGPHGLVRDYSPDARQVHSVGEVVAFPEVFSKDCLANAFAVQPRRILCYRRSNLTRRKKMSAK